MSLFGWIQALVFFSIVFILVKPMGIYMANVYDGKRTFLSAVLSPVEHFVSRLAGIEHDDEMDWKKYTSAFLILSFLSIVLIYFLQRLQNYLPLNPIGFGAVPRDLAIHTAVSFVSNTNWQNYVPEASLSWMVQVFGLTVQNFISAAAGMAVLIAFIRGFTRESTKYLGNFWVDLIRGIVHILLPLSLVLSIFLVSQGVIQTFRPGVEIDFLDQADSEFPQFIPLGPAASQVAIKMLGTNGGGFFNANAAHPFENPTPLSNFAQMVSILLIPAGLCYTFGHLIGDKRQGWVIFFVMLFVLAGFFVITFSSESVNNPDLGRHISEIHGLDTSPDGNFEGKETRFGISNSALWGTLTTAASSGSVNANLNAFSPLGSLNLMMLMMVGEVIFGGVGSGLYGMLVFVIIAVFVAGLMIGRTPEFLGKKIEIFEVKMAALLILLMPLFVLGLTALAISVNSGQSAIFNPGPRGFSEVLYAYTSQVNNNGSAFAGLAANSPFYNLTGTIAMLIGRYGQAIMILAMAGSLVEKNRVPAGSGTLSTTSVLFITWLVVIIVLVGALNFLPVLVLGPVIEQILLFGVAL